MYYKVFCVTAKYKCGGTQIIINIKVYIFDNNYLSVINVAFFKAFMSKG